MSEFKTEYWKEDPFGNRLPECLYWEPRVKEDPKGPGVYKMRRTRDTITRKESTRQGTFKQALKRYNEIMVKWDGTEAGWDKKKVPTLAAYWATYRANSVVGHKTPKPGSDPPVYRDDSLIAPALKHLGTRRLDEFVGPGGASLCKGWAQKRRNMPFQRVEGGSSFRLAEGTVARELALLHTIFESAIFDYYIDKNPWSRKRVPRARYTTRQRVLTHEEQDKLFAELSPRNVRWVEFMLGTGLRLAEALGINEKTDLDMTNRWVRVTRKTHGLIKDTQKVPLVYDDLCDILQEQLTADGELWGGLSTGAYQLMLQRAAVRVGIPHLSPHTLRHTFATRYLQAGGDIYVLSKILGHKSVSMTEKVYTHLLTEDLLLRSQTLNLTLRPREAAKVLSFKSVQ